jgi:uncharacterized protein (TIGR02001 family)
MKIVTALLSILPILPSFAQAQDNTQTGPLALSTSLGYESTYMNMGVQYAEAIYVPTVDVSYGNWYAGVWMGVPAVNAELYDVEADVYAGYRHALNDTFTLDAGLTRYAYDDIGGNFLGRNNSVEFYVGVTSTLPLSPSLYLYRDIDCNASTLDFWVSHSFELAAKLSLNLAAEIGGRVDDVDNYAFYQANADLSYALTANTSASFGVRFGGSTEELVFGDGYDKDWGRNAVWFGLGVKTGF